ncbi:MAG: TonB-dependent receptor [Proteobacteria bacterium]|nr:TonB-dependent receptor [Pseudomonadota bacterium]
MRHTPKRLAVILAATFPCFAAAAENSLTLDSVVVSGSRVEHNTFDLPAAVDVVDAERIGADQARVNASEALVAVPGITVQNRQNYAQDLQISSRGFGARSAFGVRGIRLIADGIPASMPDGQGQAATFNLDRAERIEVLRGPMAVVYGNHAGGVIQMFTPDGKGSPTLEGSFVGGSNNTWKEDVSLQGEIGGLGYVIDASHFTTDGYRQHSKAERDQTMVKLTYRPSVDGKLTFIANSFKQTAEDPQGQTWAGYQANPRSVAAAPLTYNTRKSIDHMQGGLTYEHRFGDHSVLVSAYAGQRSTLAFQSIPKATQQASTSHSGGVIDFDRDFAGASARWIGRFQLAGGKLTTTAGIEYEQAIDNRRGYENFIGTTLGVKGALRRAEEDRVATFDQYAQAEWQGERWTFSGGLRHSQVSFNVKDAFLSNGDGSGNVSYEKTTPTLAAMYRLTPSVNVYASAARGFEAPTFNELFYSGPGFSFSYNLKPSTSTHYETGLKAFVGSSSRFDLAVFQIETKDELVVDSADSGRTSYRNAGQTMRRGLETALDSRWANNLSSRVAYTYLDARYDQPFTSSSGVINADNRLPGVAAHTLFGELAWKHPASGFHAAVEGIARSKVYVEDTNTRQAAPGYAIANLRFGVDRKYGAVNLRTFLRFDNVFDRQYVGSVIVGDGNSRYYEAAPGRTWLAGISARYSF